MEDQEYIECVECHEEIEPIDAYQYVVKGVLIRPLCGRCFEEYRRQESLLEVVR